MGVPSGLVGQGDKLHAVHVQPADGRLAEVGQIAHAQIGGHILLEDTDIVHQVAQQHIGLEALADDLLEECLLGLDAAQIAHGVAAVENVPAVIAVVPPAEHTHGTVAVQKLIARLEVNFEVLGQIIVIHAPRHVKIYAADGIDQLTHCLPLHQYIEVGGHAGEGAHRLFQGLHAAFFAAAPAVDRVDHHGAAVVDDIGVTGKAHDAELLVGHIVGRQQHRIGVAAADARHQEGVKLLLAAGGQAWDLHLYLLTLLVDDGGVPGGGSGEGHLRRGAHEAEHNRPRHDDGRHHRQGNIQPQQNLLLFGARPAGLFLPLGLFFPPGTLRLLYPGAAPVVLSLFRVHQSLVPFVLLRSQSRAFTVLGCTGRPRSAISCMLISHPRSTAASRSS